MKSVTIESTYDQQYLKKALSDLEIDFRNHDTSLRVQPVEKPRLLPEIIISVVGGVSVYLISKLIDTLIDRLKPSKAAEIIIVDKDMGVSFVLPDNKEICLEHFGNPPAAAHDRTTSEDVMQLEKMLYALHEPVLVKGIVSSLSELATRNDYHACKVLVKAVAKYNIIDFDNSILETTRSIEGVYRAENIPIQLRFYAFGMRPVRDGALLEDLKEASVEHVQAVKTLETRIITQSAHPLAAELLKAYIILAFVGTYKAFSEFIGDEAFQEIISKIMTSTELVEGVNSNADFKIGRDIWKRLPEFQLLLMGMAHEVGHNVLSIGLNFPYR